MEVIALVIAAALCVGAFARLSSVGSPIVVIVVVTIGYALADLTTGVMHWFGDHIGRESWPWLGKHFVRPFREHHVDPMSITRHDFVETNGNNAIMALAPLAIVAWIAPVMPIVALVALVMLMAVIATNQIHAWAHVEQPPQIVLALQRIHLILPPMEHAQHHVAHDRSYCVTNGWMNRFLDSAVAAFTWRRR